MRLTYTGGGSTRAPGTVAALVDRGAAFTGSEVVLVDLDADRLAVVLELLVRMAAARGIDIRVTATTDRAAGIADAEVVLTSFRPRGFEARILDERIALRHSVGRRPAGGDPGACLEPARALAVQGRGPVRRDGRRTPGVAARAAGPVTLVAGRARSSRAS